MKKILGYVITCLSLIAVVVSCDKDKVGDFDPIEEVSVFTEVCTDTVFYEPTVQEIISQNCATGGCHNTVAAGGYMFLSYDSVAVNSAKILNAMKHQTVTLMPLGGEKLADSLIQQFECWIDQGKLNN